MSDGATYTTQQTADVLGMDVKTVRKAIEDGTFPLKAVKIGRNWRVSRDGVERLLAEMAETKREAS